MHRSVGSLADSHAKDLYRRSAALDDRVSALKGRKEPARFADAGGDAASSPSAGDMLGGHGARLDAVERQVEDLAGMARTFVAESTPSVHPLAALREVQEMRRKVDAREAQGEVQKLWKFVGGLQKEIADVKKDLAGDLGAVARKQEEQGRMLAELTLRLAHSEGQDKPCPGN